MNSIREYRAELYRASKSLSLSDIIKHYALPNQEDLHNMICGYGYDYLAQDTSLFDVAQSIDYFKYEKELWKLDKLK